MRRFAAMDLGTNTALLLVAERREGTWQPVLERAEITRLGQGVDGTKRLLPEAMERSARMLGEYARQARELGVADGDMAAVSTSAARDAVNGSELTALVREYGNLPLEIISGQEEARLTWKGAIADLNADDGQPLCVFDIGGGSSELIFGTKRGLEFRRSFDVGSVRMTERFLRSDPPAGDERAALFSHLRALFSEAPRHDVPPLFVGVAGTVTTLFTLIHGIEPYDAKRVHGARMLLSELTSLVDRLFQLSVAQRKELKGIEPKRADVIAAGGAILQCAMERLGVRELTVSDRGLRWGLLAERFGGRE